MSRFKRVSKEVEDFILTVRSKHFPDLSNAEFLILFDTKKRTSQGRQVYGRIKKADSVSRLLTMDDDLNPDGVDFLMFLDQGVFERADDDIKERIVRHELRHCLMDENSEGTLVYQIVGHDIEDFIAEQALNKDKPDWQKDLVKIAEGAYDETGRAIPFDPNQMGLFDGSEAGGESEGESPEPESITETEIEPEETEGTERKLKVA